MVDVGKDADIAYIIRRLLQLAQFLQHRPLHVVLDRARVGLISMKSAMAAAHNADTGDSQLAPDQEAAVSVL